MSGQNSSFYQNNPAPEDVESLDEIVAAAYAAAASVITSANNAAAAAAASAVSATASAASSTAANGSATSATNSATAAANSQSAASISATNASNSATSASNSATTATGAASTATTQATNASNSATGAANSATAAANSASQAAASASSMTPSNANPVMNGSASPGTASPYSRGDHVHPTDTTRAPLASPAFTGSPTAPTQAANDISTKLATTQFVLQQSGNSAPVMNGLATPGVQGYYSRQDHVHPTDTSRAPIDSPTFTGSPKAPNPSANNNSTLLATTAFVVTQSAGSNVRQTVSAGPAAAGLPTFLPSTNTSLSLTSQNVSSSTPLVVSAAVGTNISGQYDIVGQYAANLTWSGLTASTTCFLWVNPQLGTTGFTTLAPIYQFGGTISTVNNQFTFDYQAMIGYLGNGTTAVQTPIVFVGECVTSASGVTSSVAYAYNGKYYTGRFAVSASSTYTKIHNIGVVSPFVRITTYGATAAGGTLYPWFNVYNAAFYGAYGVPVDRNTAALYTTQYMQVFATGTTANVVESMLLVERIF